MRKRKNIFKRGDVWIGDNSNAYGRRPYLIVSNNRINRTSNSLIVCPLTSAVKKELDSHVIIRTDDVNLSKYRESTILAEQMQLIDKDNLFQYMMTLDKDEIRELNMAIVYTVGSE